MIAQLTGRLVHAEPGAVVLDVHGVGYRVAVPVGARLGPLGGELTLHTHLAVRDDALDLYGFPDPAARVLFGVLIGVSGVGPKLALAALDTLGADGVRAAVIAEDVHALTAVPGIGRKGAQRMILELREKLGALAADLFPAAGTAAHLPPHDEVRQALGALGYGGDEVARALSALPGQQHGSTEELLRLALKQLARS